MLEDFKDKIRDPIDKSKEKLKSAPSSPISISIH
jgi:hypothetical protein